MAHVPQALLCKYMALQVDCKFAQRLYLSNVVVGPSTFYSEAPFAKTTKYQRRAQQITASGVTAMEKVRVPKLCK